MTVALYLVCAVFGLVIGSFLNVVIYRVPRKLSIISPPSACPNCQNPIRGFDNIPVVSWLILRGKCRHCRAPISMRYPAVELAAAVLFVGVEARLGHSWAVPAFCALFGGALALALIDAEHLRLPKNTVWVHLSIVAIGLVAASAQQDDWRRLYIGVCCALVWSGMFLVINVISPRLLGFGDVRFALVLGLALGWLAWGYAVLGFLFANFIGLVSAMVLIATKKITAKTPVPYGVFLALGTAVAFYFGQPLLAPLHII